MPTQSPTAILESSAINKRRIGIEGRLKAHHPTGHSRPFE